jgi:hypothetical protein
MKIEREVSMLYGFQIYDVRLNLAFSEQRRVVRSSSTVTSSFPVGVLRFMVQVWDRNAKLENV